MPKKIPKKFWLYFWDVDLKKINLEKHDKFIIGRLLEWGGFASLKWLFKTFGLSKTISAFKNSRGFSKRTVNFYCYFFNLKREELRCFQKHYQSKLSWFYGR